MWMLIYASSILQVPPGWSGVTTPASTPGASQVVAGPVDTESRVPVINLKDGTRLAGDDAPRRKDLDQWLKEHPGFVADVGAFIPVKNRMRLLGYIHRQNCRFHGGSNEKISATEINS